MPIHSPNQSEKIERNEILPSFDMYGITGIIQCLLDLLSL